MGCASAKQTIEATLDDVSASPAAGLPKLLAALEKSGKDSSQQEDVKRNVPRIFELLPKVMVSVGEIGKPILTACAVIERSVKVCNDPSLAGVQAEIDVENLKQCQYSLALLMKKAGEDARKEYEQNSLEDESSSKLAKAAALATSALFTLENYGAECQEEFSKQGGVAFALNAMKTESSGIKMGAMESIARTLSMLVETPGGVKSIVAASGNFSLLPYVEEPKSYDVSKEMYGHCRAVLEACLNQDQDLKNKAAVQKVLEKDFGCKASQASQN